jgi:hypothetical protein
MQPDLPSSNCDKRQNNSAMIYLTNPPYLLEISSIYNNIAIIFLSLAIIFLVFDIQDNENNPKNKCQGKITDERNGKESKKENSRKPKNRNQLK